VLGLAVINNVEDDVEEAFRKEKYKKHRNHSEDPEKKIEKHRKILQFLMSRIVSSPIISH